MKSTADVTERLDFTGERYVPWLPGQIRYEHLHRYTSVLSLCAGKRVLDVACGEGYGAALIARHAADVVGVDIDEQTIAHANRNYGGPNLRFWHRVRFRCQSRMRRSTSSSRSRLSNILSSTTSCGRGEAGVTPGRRVLSELAQ